MCVCASVFVLVQKHPVREMKVIWSCVWMVECMCYKYDVDVDFFQEIKNIYLSQICA